jgi:hypothetical protein
LVGVGENEHPDGITRRSTMTFAGPQTTAKSLTNLVSGIYYQVKVRQRQVNATLCAKKKTAAEDGKEVFNSQKWKTNSALTSGTTERSSVRQI